MPPLFDQAEKTLNSNALRHKSAISFFCAKAQVVFGKQNVVKNQDVKAKEDKCRF